MQKARNDKASWRAGFVDNECADRRVNLNNPAEIHELKDTLTSNFEQAQSDDIIRSTKELAVLDSARALAESDLIATFMQPASGADGATGYAFLHDVARFFSGGRVQPAICLFNGGYIEVAARAPRAALKGLRRVRGYDTPAALCWRQGHSGDAPLYALDGLGQLATLLSAAGEVRQ